MNSEFLPFISFFLIAAYKTGQDLTTRPAMVNYLFNHINFSNLKCLFIKKMNNFGSGYEQQQCVPDRGRTAMYVTGGCVNGTTSMAKSVCH